MVSGKPWMGIPFARTALIAANYSDDSVEHANHAMVRNAKIWRWVPTILALPEEEISVTKANNEHLSAHYYGEVAFG